jgi:hypothetical protein
MLEAFGLLQVFPPVHIFFKVQALYLNKILSDQSCLVPCHHAILILLVAENSLGANDIGIRSFNQSPNLISLKVVQLFLHSHHPIFILKCLLNLYWFYRRNEGVILTKIC